MKSTLEKVSNLQRKLNVEVPANAVQEAFDKAYQGIQRQVAIKGFRKGKAPLTTVKTLFKDRVKEDVVSDLVQKYYGEALGQHEVEPISYPAIEFDPVQEDQSFSFSAEFEIRPEVVLKQVENLAVEKEIYIEASKVVDDTLESLRVSRAETSPVLEDRAAQQSDIVVIDFEGMVDGQPLENGSAQDHELEIGTNSFIPGFEEGIIGMRVGGSTTLRLNFPEKYHVDSLAGKPVEFKVTLKSLKKKSLPELTDDFAKSINPKFDSLETLKKEIATDHERRETRRIQEDLKNRVIRALVEKNPVEVPRTLVEEQKKMLIEDMKKRMTQQGLPEAQLSEYVEKWDGDFENSARFMVQSSFLVDAVANEKELRANPQDFDKKIEAFAAQSGVETSKVRDFYNQGDRRTRLLYQVTEEKVVDFLLSKAKIKEVPGTELKDKSTD